jgi:hypothetical protein
VVQIKRLVPDRRCLKRAGCGHLCTRFLQRLTLDFCSCRFPCKNLADRAKTPRHKKSRPNFAAYDHAERRKSRKFALLRDYTELPVEFSHGLLDFCTTRLGLRRTHFVKNIEAVRNGISQKFVIFVLIALINGERLLQHSASGDKRLRLSRRLENSEYKRE